MTTSLKASLRRLVVIVTIGSFSIAALLGIAALLSSGDFGETEIRILGTTFVLGCSSIVVLSYLATVDTRYVVLGALGGATDLVAVIIALLAIWVTSVSESDSTLKVLAVAAVCALVFAQVCLLCVLAGPRRSLGLLLWSTVTVAFAMAAIVSALILGWDAGDDGFRLVGVVSILDVLGTVVLVALGVFGSDPAQLTVTLSPAFADRLRQQADQRGQRVGDLVDEAVARYLGAPHD